MIADPAVLAALVGGGVACIYFAFLFGKGSPGAAPMLVVLIALGVVMVLTGLWMLAFGG